MSVHRDPVLQVSAQRRIFANQMCEPVPLADHNQLTKPPPIHAEIADYQCDMRSTSDECFRLPAGGIDMIFEALTYGRVNTSFAAREGKVCLTKRPGSAGGVCSTL